MRRGGFGTPRSVSLRGRFAPNGGLITPASLSAPLPNLRNPEGSLRFKMSLRFCQHLKLLRPSPDPIRFMLKLDGLGIEAVGHLKKPSGFAALRLLFFCDSLVSFAFMREINGFMLAHFSPLSVLSFSISLSSISLNRPEGGIGTLFPRRPCPALLPRESLGL